MKESCELYEWLLLMTPVDTLAEFESGQSLAVRVPWQSKASLIFDTAMEVLRSIGDDSLLYINHVVGRFQLYSIHSVVTKCDDS